MNYTLKNDYYDMTVSDVGAEIVSLKSPTGYEFLWQGGKDLWSMQAPILFPLCGSFPNGTYTVLGKERKMGLHGFALSSSFELIEKTDSSIEFKLLSNEATRKSYPFDFELKAKYSLNGNNILFEAWVKNLSDVTMPYMFGWHPGFNLPTDKGQDTTDYEIELGVDSIAWIPMKNNAFFTDKPEEYKLTNRAYRLNPAEIYPNDTMIFKAHKNFAKMFAKGHSYELSLDWSENLPTLCIWKEPIDETKFICIEPWCDYNSDGGLTNADFDKREVVKLAPGNSDYYFYNLKITE